jgi:ABC-type nitrate/sulfonate/bicarbonate transport system permease component
MGDAMYGFLIGSAFGLFIGALIGIVWWMEQIEKHDK